jgi:nitroreductase
MDKDPKHSVLPQAAADKAQLDALMRMRRSCRHFLDKEVPRAEIDEMLTLLENVPTGSNRQSLEFSVVYEKKSMDILRKKVHDRAFALAEEGIYPGNFNKEDWECQISLEHTRNHGDMFFLNTPHILIIHSPKGLGCWHIDPHLAAAWFDLICASHGLGSIIMTMPVGAMSKMPEVEALLGIPENRHYDCIVGFGYPDVEFARGVQREGIMKTTEIKL